MTHISEAAFARIHRAIEASAPPARLPGAQQAMTLATALDFLAEDVPRSCAQECRQAATLLRRCAGELVPALEQCLDVLIREMPEVVDACSIEQATEDEADAAIEAAVIALHGQSPAQWPRVAHAALDAMTCRCLGIEPDGVPA